MQAFPLTDTVRRARDLTDADRGAIAEDLRRAGIAEVRSDKFNRMLYATDASLYQMEPRRGRLPDQRGGRAARAARGGARRACR